MENSTETEKAPKLYPKRPGTSGVLGQWYETKLLSLIYFRAIHSDKIEKIYLATNVHEVGSFDDICFWAKFRGINKPIAVFLQSKHKEDNNSVFTLTKKELVNYFSSYYKIRLKFKPNDTDVLFNGEFNETHCVFVIYTTAKGEKTNKTYEGSLADHLNALMRTGDPCSRPSHDEKDVERLSKIVLEEQMAALAQQIAMCIFNEFNENQMLMKDEVVQRFHVILGQKAFDIDSKIQPEGHRVATFRDNFFDIDEEFLRLFKDALCTEILKRRSRQHRPQFRTILNSLALLREVTDTETLYKEVGSRIIYKNGKFDFLDKNTPDAFRHFLDKINESQENIRKTVETAVKECLPSLTFNVPASFGNKDLSIKGKDIKIERKLNDLTFKLVRFIENARVEASNVVLIDDSLGEGFLELSGGIASAVGNFLVLDESSDEKQQLLKINDDYESLGNLSKNLYRKLKEKIDNMHDYKFNVKARVFPKLSFADDEYDKNVVSDFLKSFLFYTSQQSEKDVEDTLIFEITNSLGSDEQHVEVTADAIFLKYHDEVQKWSTNSEEEKEQNSGKKAVKIERGTYLEKDGILYKNSVIAARQPLTSVINMIQKIQNKYYTFREEAINTIKCDGLASGTIIVTENSALTVAKLMKHLTNTVLLDFKYILNLSATARKALSEELTNTKTVKKLIVVFINAESINTNVARKLEYIGNSMKDKTVIIITDRKSVENAKKFFSAKGNVINDEIKLIDLSEESQKRVLDKKVIFQGEEVSLQQIMVDDTFGYVEGAVLNKMMHSYKNIIGKPVSDSNYKPNLYIPRRVTPLFPEIESQSTSQTSGVEEHGDRKQIQTLDAPSDDAVIIFGDPGMGKSTLLTHLSLATKKNWTEMGWIVRINLLEHTTQFSKWKDMKTSIDTLASLTFLCQAALSEESGKTKDLNITLEQSADGTVHLTGCNGDEWTVFELKMFLNFYSYRQNIIILLDGFDEICPTYMKEVLALINSVKKLPRMHKMWITSRSYEQIYTTLKNLKIGTLYHIEHLDLYEQNFYLTKFWDEMEILKDLKRNHFKNMYDCIEYVLRSHLVFELVLKKTVSTELRKDLPFFFVGLSLVKYVKMNLKSAPSSIMKLLEARFDASSMEPTQIFENEFVATPLHLEIMADYFFNKIKEINVTRNEKQWSGDYDIFDIYSYYLKTKLRIRLGEKTQNDMSKPENQSTYDQKYTDCLEKYKKIAAYGVYYRSRTNLFDDDELRQIMDLINELKRGEERTGIICNIVDDRPLFVHSTFEEHLAVEYICDLIKAKDNQKWVWDFIMNVVFFGNINVLASLNDRMGRDDLLILLFKFNKKIIFQLLLEQGKNRNTRSGRIQSAMTEAIRYNLHNVIRFFIFNTLNYILNENNLVDFIEIVKETNVLLLAVKMENESVIKNLIGHVKRVDESKLTMLYENIELKDNLAELSNDEVIHKLHGYLWTRMGVVPDFNNSIFEELRSQIDFI